jgi:MoaA/NifB/PqqE/SkfB family radical SAM enzyme
MCKVYRTDMSNPFQFALSFADYLLSRKLKHMIVHVTNHCNFRCRHCFVDFDKKKDLPLEFYEQLARDVGDLFWLDIGGGEPFLRKDLHKIIASFNARVVHIPSNGSLPDLMVEQLGEIKRNNDAEIVIGLSLDGLRDMHDLIRGTEGNWDQVWGTYEKLRALGGLSIKITTVINTLNYDEILPLMDEVKQRGVDFHSVILMRGAPLDPTMTLPDLEALRKIGPPIFERLEKYDYGRSPLSAYLLRNFHRLLWNTSLDTIDQETQIIPCLAGQSHAVVMGDGGLSSCEMLPAVGNLRTHGLNEILASAAFREQVEDIRNKKCHCTHNCAMLASIFFNPKNFPKLIHQKVT